MVGPASAFVSIKEKYEKYESAITRYITPNDIKFITCFEEN
jgi:hypothetical protein